MIDPTITANTMVATAVADDADAAILAHLRDIGYESVAEAAEVCDQSVEEFLADITVTEVAA